MTTKNTGGPAFPLLNPKIGYHADIRQDEPGLSIRDYFAAKALQGICASGPEATWTDDRLAKEAYALADAMLEARGKE